MAAAPTEGILSTGTADDIMTLADVARRAGRNDVAERSYRAARSRFGGTDIANRATFLLGRILAESDRSVESETLFLEYVRSGHDVFAAEAHGRLLQLAHVRGDRTIARDRAESYLARYPKSAFAELARSILAP